MGMITLRCAGVLDHKLRDHRKAQVGHLAERVTGSSPEVSQVLCLLLGRAAPR